jgi:hypothetical protein
MTLITSQEAYLPMQYKILLLLHNKRWKNYEKSDGKMVEMPENVQQNDVV